MCPSVTFLKLIYANIAYCPVLHVRTVFRMPFVLLPALTETFVGYAESAGMSVISMWRVSYYDFVWFFRARSIPKKCLVSQQDGQIDCWGAIWTTVWVSCIKWSWWFIIIRMPTFLIVFCNLSIFRGLYLSSSWALFGFFFHLTCKPCFYRFAVQYKVNHYRALLHTVWPVRSGWRGEVFMCLWFLGG